MLLETRSDGQGNCSGKARVAYVSSQDKERIMKLWWPTGRPGSWCSTLYRCHRQGVGQCHRGDKVAGGHAGGGHVTGTGTSGPGCLYRTTTRCLPFAQSHSLWAQTSCAGVTPRHNSRMTAVSVELVQQKIRDVRSLKSVEFTPTETPCQLA